MSIVGQIQMNDEYYDVYLCNPEDVPDPDIFRVFRWLANVEGEEEPEFTNDIVVFDPFWHTMSVLVSADVYVEIQEHQYRVQKLQYPALGRIRVYFDPQRSVDREDQYFIITLFKQ